MRAGARRARRRSRSRRRPSPTSRSGRSAPAARRRPRSPRPAHAFIRGAGRGLRGVGERVRIQYGGSVKPENAGGALGPAGHRRRPGRRREPRPGRLRGASLRGGADEPSRSSAWSSSTGAASRRRGRATRSSLAAHAGVRRAVGRLARTRSSPPPAARSACRTGRWATARSATSTSAPAASCRQVLVRIDEALGVGRVLREPGAASTPAAGARGSALHLIGLVSDGGVHASRATCSALIELASREGVERVHVHAFTDGRDTSPTGGRRLPRGASPASRRSCGRYYAMDRDRRWDRIERAYDAMVHGDGRAGRRSGGRGARSLRARASPTSSSSRS